MSRLARSTSPLENCPEPSTCTDFGCQLPATRCPFGYIEAAVDTAAPTKELAAQ